MKRTIQRQFCQEHPIGIRIISVQACLFENSHPDQSKVRFANVVHTYEVLKPLVWDGRVDPQRRVGSWQLPAMFVDIPGFGVAQNHRWVRVQLLDAPLEAIRCTHVVMVRPHEIFSG